MAAIRIFLSFALLLMASPLLRGDVGIVGEDFGDVVFSRPPGVGILVLPLKKSLEAGKNTKLTVGIENFGKSTLIVIAFKVNVHLLSDRRKLVQNVTLQASNYVLRPSQQHIFHNEFVVSKDLQTNLYDLVASVVYEISDVIYQNSFFNDTIEVENFDFDALVVECVVVYLVALVSIFPICAYVKFQLETRANRTHCSKIIVGSDVIHENTEEDESVKYRSSEIIEQDGNGECKSSETIEEVGSGECKSSKITKEDGSRKATTEEGGMSKTIDEQLQSTLSKLSRKSSRRSFYFTSRCKETLFSKSKQQ